MTKYISQIKVIEEWENANPDVNSFYTHLPSSAEVRGSKNLGIFLMSIVSAVMIFLNYLLLDDMFAGPKEDWVGNIVVIVIMDSFISIFFFIGYYLYHHSQAIFGYFFSREMFITVTVRKNLKLSVEKYPIHEIAGMEILKVAEEVGSKLSLDLYFLYNHNPMERSSTGFLLKEKLYAHMTSEFLMLFPRYRNCTYEYPRMILRRILQIDTELEEISKIEQVLLNARQTLFELFPEWNEQELRISSRCDTCTDFFAWHIKHCPECGSEITHHYLIHNLTE
ncbi:MAG: hypothetical protein INQ03_14485 [Candidatus Heimdallarchaeota archaeon]|nr:hypothetical protein [Candidatus Heimdallarchaeota archaeon]